MTGPVFCFYMDCAGFEPTTIGYEGRSSTTELTVFPQDVLVPLLRRLLTHRIQHASMSFGLRPNKRSFRSPGIISPYSLKLLGALPREWSNYSSYLLIIIARLVGWIGAVAKLLWITLVRITVSFRTHSLDLPTIATRGRRRTTLRVSPASSI